MEYQRLSIAKQDLKKTYAMYKEENWQKLIGECNDLIKQVAQLRKDI